MNIYREMDFIPGLFQGITRVCIGYPFDYMKIHAQYDLKFNITQEMIRVRKNNTFSELYHGVSLPLVINPLRRSIQYATYEYMNNLYNPLVSGAIAGITISVINIPYYNLLNKYVVTPKTYNLSHYIQKNIQNKSIVHGYEIEVMRSCISSTIYLGMYGYLREKLEPNKINCVINTMISSIVTRTLTYPLDTARLWYQLTPTQQPKKENICLRIKTEGIKSVWRGISMIYLRVVPTNVISMLIYEHMRKLTQSS